MGSSLFYRSPVLYHLMLRAVHGKGLQERYRLIAGELGAATSVFEPMCGPALLPQYLAQSVHYRGFDINAHFVEYAQRKGRAVDFRDVRDPESFRGVSADGVVLIDALHHLWPYEEQQRAVERSAAAANNTLIICDPFGDRVLDFIDTFPFLRRPIERIFNWAERDGPNQSRFDHLVKRDTLEARMTTGFGVLSGVKTTIQQVGSEDLVATYSW